MAFSNIKAFADNPKQNPADHTKMAKSIFSWFIVRKIIYFTAFRLKTIRQAVGFALRRLETDKSKEFVGLLIMLGKNTLRN